MSLPPAPGATPEPTLLIIADISGYTRYMTANAKTLAHSQTIITELVMAIVREVQLPLELAKLEGDAVFLYCRKMHSQAPWDQTRDSIGAKLLSFFQLFADKTAELRQSTTCSCSACQNIERLRLKVIAHSGDVLFHQVFHLQELAGVDVILVHRLLKNSVPSDQYLLLTEAALQDVHLPDPVPWVAGTEDVPDIGPVRTFTYIPPGAAIKSSRRQAADFRERFARSWSLYRKLWFHPLHGGQHPHRHLQSGATPAGRALWAALTALLTPIALPVAALFVLLHSLKRGSG